jgi:hypothetical protein
MSVIGQKEIQLNGRKEDDESLPIMTRMRMIGA